jgi:hypothetical protein
MERCLFLFPVNKTSEETCTSCLKKNRHRERERRTWIIKSRIAALAGARERLIIPPRNSFGTYLLTQLMAELSTQIHIKKFTANTLKFFFFFFFCSFESPHALSLSTYIYKYIRGVSILIECYIFFLFSA